MLIRSFSTLSQKLTFSLVFLISGVDFVVFAFGLGLGVIFLLFGLILEVLGAVESLSFFKGLENICLII
jgi:hypothetical protein